MGKNDGFLSMLKSRDTVSSLLRKLPFFGCELSFRYRTYKILEQDDEELEASNNPFALVVLAAKRNLQSREDEDKRFSFKRELVRLMLEKGFCGHFIIQYRDYYTRR